MSIKIMIDDAYILNTIRKGDAVSRILDERFKPTLKLSNLVRIIKGSNLPVLDIPTGNEALVHSRGGTHELTDLFDYGYSVVNNLVSDAKAAGAVPVALADVIEVPDVNEAEVRRLADGIAKAAEEHKLPIMNGEYAVHGYRVNSRANVSATMISTREWSVANHKSTFTINRHGFGDVVYAAFFPDGKAVYINSDGVGTKTECYELANLHELAVDDWMAMTMDDTGKIGAIVKAISGVAETSGDIPIGKILTRATDKAAAMKIAMALQHEQVGNRIRGYQPGMPSYNIAGSVVSVIDEERLHNLPRPNVGDKIIAIVGTPNVRSNGLTSRRKDLRETFGEDFYKSGRGKKHLDYLTIPSIIFYPFATETLSSGGTGFFHMSGGAYDGKFARPLAKHNLFGDITERLRIRDNRELFFLKRAGNNPEVCYGKYPCNYDAFVTAPDFASVEAIARRHGLQAIQLVK